MVELTRRDAVVDGVGPGVAVDPEPVRQAGRLAEEGGVGGRGGDELRGELRRRAILGGEGAGPGGRAEEGGVADVGGGAFPREAVDVMWARGAAPLEAAQPEEQRARCRGTGVRGDGVELTGPLA